MQIKDLAPRLLNWCGSFDVGAVLFLPAGRDLLRPRGAGSSLLRPQPRSCILAHPLQMTIEGAASSAPTSNTGESTLHFHDIFSRQKVHYNALFAKFRPKYAL
jgi:hypothetical protein